MERPKVIVLYNQLFHYRIPVWNCLAKYCDLTVTYSDGKGDVPTGMDVKFDIMYLPKKTFASRFVWQKANIRKLVKDYDAIISYGDIAWLKYSTLPWCSNNKVVYHTLGVSASYEKGYDEHKEWDKIRAFFYSKAKALAFYTEYPIDKYVALGIPKEKMFVARNTVAVEPIEEPIEKDSIIVIGTLYRAKGLQLLLDSYLELKNEVQLPELNIIGKGPDYDAIKQWIDDNKIGDIIKLRGAIYDIKEKARYFARSLACISPKQAGLTVLESMGYGVPFVSSKNAITGGELQNVHNGIDGVVMDDVSQLTDVVREIAHNKEKYIEMGKMAQKYYNENCTPQHMADGLWAAVQYALNH